MLVVHSVGMPSAGLSLRPDGADALQAWVDVTADDVAVRMLLDTGSAGTDVPRIEPFASRVTDACQTGKSASGKLVSTSVAYVHALQVGALVVENVVVGVQAGDWPHPALLGMNVLSAHPCHFQFGAGWLEMDGELPPSDWIPLTTGSDKTPAVDVRWGPKSVSAIWDTGAGITLVDQNWAMEHPDVVTILNETDMGTDSSGHTRSNPKGRLAACRIGDVDFDEQRCGVVDFSDFNGSSATPVYMFAGLPLMSQATWAFDFPSRRWTVYRE